VLETTLTGVALTVDGDVTAAVTGAPAEVRVDGQAAPLGKPVELRRGQLLEVRTAQSGVRSYVAFAGGLAVPRVLGSASADLLSGLGPVRLADGDVLPLGMPGAADGGHGCALGELPVLSRDHLLLYPGPRADWLAAPGLAALEKGDWTVTPDSNRVALQLAGSPVGRRRGELASEGLVAGAIQALPDGHLVLFLADHPTTGGYPVIAVVGPACLAACAQARPGSTVRFRVADTRS
jgi:biotin-dependent carboxylase-like uncharacterized protein